MSRMILQNIMRPLFPKMRQLWVAAVLTLCSQASAQVILNDGGTYEISDATYQLQNIVVENGTTVIFKTGAMVEGRVDIFDTSQVVIEGGQFGGAEQSSGRLFAWGESVVTILGGSFGGAGGDSGRLDGYDSARIYIFGGVHGVSGWNGQGSHICVGSATLEVHGGVFNESGIISMDEQSVAKIYGDNFQWEPFIEGEYRGGAYGLIRIPSGFYLWGTLADGNSFSRLGCHEAQDGRIFLLPGH